MRAARLSNVEVGSLKANFVNATGRSKRVWKLIHHLNTLQDGLGDKAFIFFAGWSLFN